MHDALDYFQEKGKHIKTTGNQTLHLDDPGVFRLVLAGRVDVFAAPTESGKPPGARTHVCRVEEGGALFAFPPQTDAQGIEFMAVPGPDTELNELPMDSIVELAGMDDYAESILGLINEWVTTVSMVVSASARSRKIPHEVHPPQELQLANGNTFRTSEEPLWVSVKQGQARFLSREELPPIQSGACIPISRRTWLTALGDATLMVTHSPDLVDHPDVVLRDLLDFNRLMARVVLIKLSESDEKESQRLRSGSAVDRRLRERAYTRLSAVLVDKDALSVPSEGDPLVDACLMVATFLGMRIRDRLDLTVTRDLLDPLRGLARECGFHTRTILLKGEWWYQDNGPLLAYKGEEGSPVAILPLGPKKYVMWDPVDETRTEVNATTAKDLQPHGYVIYRPFPDGAINGRVLLRFGLHDCRKDLWRVLLMGIVGGLVSLVTPIATAQLFDTIIPDGNRSHLAQMAVALVVGACAIGTFAFVQAVAQLRIAGRMGAVIQAALWDRLLNLPAEFFRRFTSGDLTNRALGITQIQNTLSNAAVSSILAGAFSLVNFLLLFYYSPRLALVALLIVLIVVLFGLVCLRLQLKYQRPLYTVIGKIQGMTLQFLNGVAKLRVGAAEIRAFNKWAGEYAKQKRLDYKSRMVTIAVVVFGTTIPLVSSLIMFGLMAYLHRPSSPALLTTGEFLGFIAALTTILVALTSSMMFLFPVLCVVPMYERTRPILEAMPEARSGKADPGRLTGHVEVAQAFFRYTPDGPLILKGVSLSARPGEFIALVGPSGSGKSTIFRLLLGFETPESGSVYYDGQELAGLDLQSTRRQLGVVIQNGKLLAGNIFRNIVGATNLTLNDAWEAARMAAVDEDIKAMPMQMHTMVGEGGAGLSGGQRQRLLIARAIVREPKILLFDEATSALDNQSQATVTRSLERLQVTRIVIAHRLSTIRDADRIFVVVDGEIVENGNYDELMAMNGVFTELVKRQTA